MKRAPFIPGRDQRHRQAVLALYRTLIREAQRVPLPEPYISHGAGNPISCIIRKRFASNKSCTSPRLIYAALAAGYQFIDVLAKARSPSSAAHARLLNHVRCHPLPSPKPRPASPPTRLPRLGLLTKVVNPDGTYKYVPTNPPSLDPSWATRRPPHMGRTSESQTFLRFRKPQPVFLTRKLIKHRAITVRNVDKVKRVENRMMAVAMGEDMWEEVVARQMKLEGVEDAGRTDGVEASYRWSVAISRLWHLWKWERRWYDLVARGDGHQAFLDEIVKIQEAAAPGVNRSESVLTSTSPHGPTSSRVKIARQEKIYPLMTTVKKLTGTLPSSVEADPFAAPYWSLLVQNQHGRLEKMLPPLKENQEPPKAS